MNRERHKHHLLYNQVMYFSARSWGQIWSTCWNDIFSRKQNKNSLTAKVIFRFDGCSYIL